MGGGVWRIFCAGCNMRGPGVRVHSNTPRDEQQWASTRSEELWNALPRKMSLPEWQSEPPVTDDDLVLAWHTHTNTYTVLHKRGEIWVNGRNDSRWDREDLIHRGQTRGWRYRPFNASWPGSEAVFRYFLDWRALDPAEFCPECEGAGVRSYASTSTWAGGIGGMQITADICDKCWGSGSDRRPGVNLRRLRGTKMIPAKPSHVDDDEWAARMACVEVLIAPEHLDWVAFEAARGKIMDAVHAARRIREGEPDQEQYWAWVGGLKPGALVQLQVVPNTHGDPQLLPGLYRVERLTRTQLVVTGWWAKFRRVHPVKDHRGGVPIGWCVMTEAGGGRARLKMPSQATLEAAANTTEKP